MLEWIVKWQALFYQVSELNVSRRKRGLYFLAEIFNGRIYSNVTVITVTRKFANYCDYSNVDVSAVSTGLINGLSDWNGTETRKTTPRNDNRQTMDKSIHWITFCKTTNVLKSCDLWNIRIWLILDLTKERAGKASLQTQNYCQVQF